MSDVCRKRLLCLLRFLTVLAFVLGTVGLGTTVYLGLRDPQIRRKLSFLLSHVPVAKAASVQASLPVSLNGRLSLDVTTILPVESEILNYTAGDFLGNGSTTVFLENDSAASRLVTLAGRTIEEYPSPPAMLLGWPDSFRVHRHAVLPAPGGDLLLRVDSATATLEAITFPTGRAVWQAALPGLRSSRLGQVGVLRDAAGPAAIWVTDDDSGTLHFFDTTGGWLQSRLFRVGTRFFTGDFDGQPGEELLLFNAAQESLLLAPNGDELRRLRFSLPAIASPAFVLPAAAPDGTPQLRMEFTNFSPLFYNLEGALVEAPGSERIHRNWHGYQRAADVMTLPDGERLVVSSYQITLLDANGRMLDLVEDMTLFFLPCGSDAKGNPVVLGVLQTQKNPTVFLAVVRFK
ncbi:MAG: hypothetical protein PWP23_3061 [Candidatus Sumerlaeota bacterium]|nr:hypothetical protein [Candidatus Sumerlaeota bacterium]